MLLLLALVEVFDSWTTWLNLCLICHWKQPFQLVFFFVLELKFLVCLPSYKVDKILAT